MHPNQSFRGTDEETARAFASGRGFGVLTASGPEGPLASHIPFLIEGDRVEAHLVRSTALARVLRRGPLDALLIVSGPDGYISPDWYGEDDKVPTWNYIAVHLRGRLRLAEEQTIHGHLDRLSTRFENALAPKPVWTLAKMTPGVAEKMMKSIVLIELSLTGVESTFKLNQNRTDEARQGAISGLEAGSTPGMETAELARRMRRALDD